MLYKIDGNNISFSAQLTRKRSEVSLFNELWRYVVIQAKMRHIFFICAKIAFKKVKQHLEKKSIFIFRSKNRWNGKGYEKCFKKIKVLQFLIYSIIMQLNFSKMHLFISIYLLTLHFGHYKKIFPCSASFIFP